MPTDSPFHRPAADLLLLLICWGASSGLAGAQFQAFVHEATSSNTFGFVTQLDHPALNDAPDQRFVVQPVFNPLGLGSGVTNDAYIGIRYSSSSGRWSIENQDLSTPIPIGSKFFVLIPIANKDGEPDNGFVHVVTEASSTFTTIDHPQFNNRGGGSLVATWTRTPPGHSGPLEPPLNAPFGIDYRTAEDKWRIETLDSSGMPQGGGFAIFGVTEPATRTGQTVDSGVFTFDRHSATVDNISLDLTRMAILPRPYDFVFVAHRRSGAANPHPLQVAYDFFDGVWAITNTDEASMPVGSQYFVISIPILFLDGFETGNTNTWSSSVP